MLNNKIAVITGIYNSHSISYGILQNFIKEKAQVVCLVQNSKIKDKLQCIFDNSFSKDVYKVFNINKLGKRSNIGDIFF